MPRDWQNVIVRTGVRYVGLFPIHFAITGLKDIIRYTGARYIGIPQDCSLSPEAAYLWREKKETKTYSYVKRALRRKQI